jgi:hypothetical protein
VQVDLTNAAILGVGYMIVRLLSAMLIFDFVALGTSTNGLDGAFQARPRPLRFR